MTEEIEELRTAMFKGAVPTGSLSTRSGINKFRESIEGVYDGDARFNVYSLYAYADEPPEAYFDAWDDEDLVNPLYTYLVDFITAQVFANYEFRGPGAPAVRKYWQKNNMYAKIKELGRETIKYGTGIALKGRTGKKVKGIHILNTSDFTVALDGWRETWTYEGSEEQIQDIWTPTTDFSDRLLILRLNKRPDHVWGFSPLHTSYHSLQGLYKIIVENIPAATENFMAVERVALLDLTGCKTPAERLDAMQTFQRDWDRVNAAKAGIHCVDKNHVVGHLGGLTGGMQSRLEDVMKFIEPLMSIVLLNAFHAIGMIRQDGANKSIIKRQEWKAYELLQPLRQYMADEIYRQIIHPHIIKNLHVEVVHRLPYEMQMEMWEAAIAAYQGGILPREYLQYKVSFEPEDFKTEFGIKKLTYIEDIEMKIAAAAPAPMMGGGAAGKKEPKLLKREKYGEGEKGEENDAGPGGGREKD